MSKKHFIALADRIKFENRMSEKAVFSTIAISSLADFCKAQNPMFNRDRWLSYIAGECGPNGGTVKG